MENLRAEAPAFVPSWLPQAVLTAEQVVGTELAPDDLAVDGERTPSLDAVEELEVRLCICLHLTPRELGRLAIASRCFGGRIDWLSAAGTTVTHSVASEAARRRLATYPATEQARVTQWLGEGWLRRLHEVQTPLRFVPSECSGWALPSYACASVSLSQCRSTVSMANTGLPNQTVATTNRVMRNSGLFYARFTVLRRTGNGDIAFGVIRPTKGRCYCWAEWSDDWCRSAEGQCFLRLDDTTMPSDISMQMRALVDAGFQEQAVVAALARSNGDADQAAQLLLGDKRAWVQSTSGLVFDKRERRRKTPATDMTIGLLLDANHGTLTVYKTDARRTDQRLGVIATGLTGPLVWAVKIRGGDSVRIDAAAVPAADSHAARMTRARRAVMRHGQLQHT